MASSIKSSSGCSPDSTVSSLLTSCSTDSSNPHSDSLICYKGKLYSSASEALEAYIEDFDLSLTSPDVRTGKISMCQSTPKQVKFSKPHAKAKHGLEDFNQQLGLDALASLCPRQAECDPELLSLATDDLLGFPEDGSLPFVQSTPSKPKLPSRSPRPLAFEELSGTWKNYPRWLTSHKAELSVSGITSIPSLHYPLWLSSYSLASHSTNERDGQGF
ncbi:lung adenoma susceptibility protein 2 [Phaethornis superciliosus]